MIGDHGENGEAFVPLFCAGSKSCTGETTLWRLPAQSKKVASCPQKAVVS